MYRAESVWHKLGCGDWWRGNKEIRDKIVNVALQYSGHNRKNWYWVIEGRAGVADLVILAHFQPLGKQPIAMDKLNTLVKLGAMEAQISNQNCMKNIAEHKKCSILLFILIVDIHCNVHCWEINYEYTHGIDKKFWMHTGSHAELHSTSVLLVWLYQFYFSWETVSSFSLV